MSQAESTARAIEWLESQIADLSDIRNATTRDPSFKNWRQATLTGMQRFWPGDQARSERFRRIPFSPVDPRADARVQRESYSSGCMEAGRVLNGLMAEIRAQGVPDVPGGPRPDSAEIEFEDGFPAVDLPTGDLGDSSNMADLAENLLAELADTPPQGTDPALMESARAQINLPGPVRKGLSMKARLRDLLGLANLSKGFAGPSRVRDQAAEPSATDTSVTQPDRETAAHNVAVPAPPATPAAERLEMQPVGDSLEARMPPSPSPSPTHPRQTTPPPTTSPSTTSPAANRPSQLISPPSRSGEWPLPNLFTKLPAPLAPAPQPPIEAQAAAADSAAEPSQAPDAPRSASRSKTLRGSIEKVSIESLISPEFRDATGPMNEPPEQDTPDDEAVAWPGLALVPPRSEYEDDVPETDPSLESEVAEVEPATPAAPQPVVPAESLPPAPIVSRISSTTRPSVVAPPASTVTPPVHKSMQPTGGDEDSALEDEAKLEHTMSEVDAEAFARATEDFMRTSPVLGATARGPQRDTEKLGFSDADAIAVSSMAQDLVRMEVPNERHAEVRARLLDLARRIERSDLEWSALRRAVWFAMEYPELARRLMPVLLPWIDRAA